MDILKNVTYVTFDVQVKRTSLLSRRDARHPDKTGLFKNLLVVSDQDERRPVKRMRIVPRGDFGAHA